VDGVSYPISAHGFAKKSEFILEKSGTNFLTFSIHSDENTKQVYPFDFIFCVTYRIDGDKLTVEYAVENTGETPLYFACGSHETYALDQSVDAYELRFDKDETFTHLYHDKAGYLTGETKEFGMGKIFPLPRDFLQKGATIIFQNLNSSKVSLWEKDGEKLADVTFDGFSNMLLWRAGDGKFICIEPWTNLPDYAGAKDSEFSTKAGVMCVEKKQTKTLIRTITYY
jgi:galactose mutarotase-like enzyme